MYEDEEPPPPPVLDRKDSVLIITRPQFEGDLRRHFVGVVDRCENGIIRVHGYAFVRDQTHGGFVKRKSQRSRVFSLDNQIVVFVLPDDTEISSVRYEKVDQLGLVVTDGKQFKLELEEFNT